MTFDDNARATPVVTIPALTAGTELTFTLTVTGRGGTDRIAPATDTAKVTVFDPAAGICGRTMAVREALVATISGITFCANVTDTHLAAITTGLSLNGKGITALAAGDFDGLTGVPYLDLQDNELAELPAGVFDNLTALTELRLYDNQLATLPANVFAGLTSLTTLNLRLNPGEPFAPTADALPDDGTVPNAGGTVTVTRAANNAPTASDGSVTTDEDTAHTFAEDEFNFADSDGDALARVTVETLPTAGGLALDGTAVTVDQAVPAAKIRDLVFTPEANAKVTALDDPATGKPSIRGSAWVGGTLRVVTTDITDEDGLTGATYGYQWVRVDADGMSNATDITSETSDTYVPVEADVGKKVRVKVSFTDDGGGNEELTSDAYPSSGTIEAEAPGICGRTRQVRVRILDRIPRVSDCALVTDARLANITGTLELQSRKIDTLAAGDFAGLTALTTLNLGSNDLTTLPDDVFDGLTALTGLYLNSNELRTLDDDVFAPLPALTDLRLSTNRLTTLPAGVFAGLTALQELNLSNNRLNTLDAGVFAGLTELTTLRLEGNRLNTLGRRGVRRADRAGDAASGKQRFGHAGRRGVRRADRADDAGSGLQRPDHVARRRVRAADRPDGSAVVGQSRGALRAGGGCPAR